MREALFHSAIGETSFETRDPLFNIYRNNISAALINALRVRYPVVKKLLGPENFTAITGEFVAAHRPRSPVLIGYGDDYPDFIASRIELPYIADVARLESLWWGAYHAADAEPLAPSRFAELTAENLETARFIFHPSAAIISSQWAVGAIWDAARRDTEIQDIARPQSVLVWRPHADVRVHVIDDASSSFLKTLMRGKALPEALAEDSSMETQFEMLIGLQLVTAIETGTRQ